MQKIILGGDSIRMYYQPLVTEKLRGEFEVREPQDNWGTSENVLANLDEWAIRQTADIIHINCGLHDLALKEDGAPRVPVEAYETNVRSILSRLKQETSSRIIWATTTPVIDEWHRRVKSFERREEDVLRYNVVATRVAEECGIEIDDLHAVIASAGPEKCLMPDGVHTNEFGNELLARAVSDYVRL